MCIKNYIYPAIFTYEDGQEIAVVFPDLDIATSGIDDRDALASARECLIAAITGLVDDGEDMPVPSRVDEIKTNANERVIVVEASI